MQEFVKLAVEQEKEQEEAIAAGETLGDELREFSLPVIPYVRPSYTIRPDDDN